jgi:ankyrin repeat protein
MSRLLIANGADLSLRDVRDATPVHAVASRGENSADAENIVRLLASSGCDVAAFDEDGDSPLHVAVKARSPRMVVALVNGGARTSVRSPLTGLTPLQAACAQPSLDPETGLFDVEVIRNLLGVGSCPNLPVRRGANVRRGTVDKAGVGAEEEERMAALHVLLCGANKEKLVVDPNKPYEDGSPRFIVDEQCVPLPSPLLLSLPPPSPLPPPPPGTASRSSWA